ncbi:hypothetical protein FB567DRAFT_67025 [Paraphoma chrysanthemicola]|uniref:Integral membrane protein n=1 Tax=Paraphoma chrysanthemicola TaxID=798071 RepID=A0A8K0R6G8_9PLEO|nr:hypothetical protein FB567DRAFT_67025 [Paraphoma chrysanthemicola]
MHKLASTALLALVGLPLGLAAPLPPDPIIIEDKDHYVYLGEHPVYRTITVVMCIVYAFLLAGAQGYRAGRMAHRKARMRFADILVFIQGFICTAFLFAVGINTSGLGLSTDAQCHAAIRVCIAMYGSVKMILTLFLLERVRIVRAPFVSRLRDPIWVIGAIITVGGYGGIMSYQSIAPEAQLSRTDGHCRIGSQNGAAIAIIVFDTVLNVSLTSIFVWQLRPAIRSRIHWPLRRAHGPGELHQQSSWWRRSSKSEVKSGPGIKRLSSHGNLRIMLIRNVVGSILLLANTVANNAIYLSWTFARMSHACQLMCLTDIVLGMLITQWLTMRSAEEALESGRQTPAVESAGSGGTSNLPSRRLTMESWRSPTCYNDKVVSVSNSRYALDVDAIQLSLR